MSGWAVSKDLAIIILKVWYQELSLKYKADGGGRHHEVPHKLLTLFSVICLPVHSWATEDRWSMYYRSLLSVKKKITTYYSTVVDYNK